VVKKGFSKPLFSQIAPEKREMILSIAVEEFAEKGFSQANINTIAARSGISVGSIYKYFSSKEDLYLTVVQLGYARLDEVLSPILESETEIATKIALLVDALFEYSGKYANLTRLYNRFTTEGNTELASRLADSLETLTAQGYSKLLQTAVDEGLINSTVDSRMLAFCMDNILLVMQFSLTGEYYRDRMHIYLGDTLAENKEQLKIQLLKFLYQAIGMRTE
jgi:AcrR family transcriptional regulator